MIYDIPLQSTTVPADEPGDRIVAFLIKNGTPTADAFVYIDEAGSWVHVDANSDPSDLLKNYVSEQTREERAWADLRAFKTAVKATPDMRTNLERIRDLEKAMLASMRLQRLDTE